MSSWVNAPERGLDPIVKDNNEFQKESEQFSFTPELQSDPSLREKAKSAGYGKQTVQVKPKTERVGDLSILDEPPSFAPELVSDQSLRENAKSSGYGSAVPQKKQVEKEVPEFKPDLVTKKSAVSAQWTEKASSSAYGRNSVASDRPKTAPQAEFTFTPQLPPNKARETASSSRYGQVVPERPRTAPSNERNGASPIGKPDKTEKKTDDKPEPVFVLDCVQYANAKSTPGAIVYEAERSIPGFAVTKQLKENAHSSNYGVESPPSKPKPEPKPPQGRFKFEVSNSPLAQPLEKGPLKTPLADTVQSHKYGQVSPEKAPRPEPKQGEKVWTVTLKGSIPTELEPPPRTRLSETAQGHAYGKVPLPKGERVEHVSEPVWAPTSPSRHLPQPVPVPRSPNYDHIQSQYGKTYKPSRLSQPGTPEVHENGDSQ